MSASRSLVELAPDIQEEIKVLAMRVTQGMPAFRSLRAVLTEKEWQEILPELSGYFPPSAPGTRVSAAEARRRKSAPAEKESAGEANGPASEPVKPELRRPEYYAIKTLMRLRNLTQCRAIIELARATELLTEAGYRRLLREIGEQDVSLPADTSSKLEWDKGLCELRLNGKVIKRVRGPKIARNVVRVLDAFQEQGWARHTCDPLPGGRDQKRLHDTIQSLNDDLEGIRFRADGTGEGICWDLAPSP